MGAPAPLRRPRPRRRHGRPARPRRRVHGLGGGNLNQHPDLQSLVAEIGGLRPLAETARNILQITVEDRFSAYELANAIAADQALTARMLRLANSAYYGYARRISTMRDAVVLLGFREVRSATVAACVIETLPASTHIDYQTFWHYSVSVGMLAEVIARAERHQPDEAFTAGVLHNVGRLALDQHRPAHFARALAYASVHQVTLHEAQRHELGFTDAELGGALAAAWDFPPPLADAVRRHDTDPADLLDAHSLLGFVVRARAFARTYGLSDAVESRTPQSAPPSEWLEPPLSSSLRVAGGLGGVLQRVDVFLNHALDQR